MPEEDRIARIEEIVTPVLRDHGLELVDLEWRAHGPRGLLRVYVDKPGGVGIRDCERVSREIGDVLDVSDVIEHRYDLEVSSPGLDRPLRKEREYRWAVGKRVKCWVAEGSDVTGRLVAVTDDRLVVDVEGVAHEVPRSQVRKARLEAEVPWRRQA
jgi:ribosome maturation factor RimP